MSNRVPIIATKGIYVFPKFANLLELTSAEAQRAVHTANNQMVIVSSLIDESKEASPSNIYPSGTLVRITNIQQKDSSSSMKINVVGLTRIKIKEIKKTDGFYSANYSEVNESNIDSEKAKKLSQKLFGIFESKAKYFNVTIPKQSISPFRNAPTDEQVDAISAIAPIEKEVKQSLISTGNVEKRMEILIKYLGEDQEVDVKTEIDLKVNKKLSKHQKEFYLREQIKAAQEELDEINGKGSETEELRKRVNLNPYPENIKAKLFSEIDRLEQTPNQAAESGIIRNYIDWLINLPYWQKSKEDINIEKVRKQLNKDHYGIEDAKKRIVEYIAVKQVNPDRKAPVISLVGPPGTGKTSIAKSIAKSLDRKFVKISLGGVKDESEIRGHRRTYLAAMPGKIIQAMKKAGVVNPVILIDEIDKMSSDFKGDPSSAMLEVLDPEQNTAFQDHYLEEEYDLSQVMFIATANYESQIPEPLHDRLEHIRLSSYTELEKIQIAKKHLIPEVLKNNKLKKSEYKMTDKILTIIISHYTREAGVRQLSRVLDKVARKIVVRKLEKKIKTPNFTITEPVLTEMLGPKKFNHKKKEKASQLGVTTGLAWTQYGGAILPIEVTKFKGKGDLTLTGQLRDVMKESATIALSYVRANHKDLDIKDNKVFKEFDIHVHTPDGATPKDGPSAGVTFTTSLISLLSNKKVPSTVAMTGEITLRGNVLPIGGLKEKTIAALKTGIKKVYIPKENERDINELPAEVKKGLEIIPVSHYNEIYKDIFR